MNECSAISDSPASTPSMKSTSHFGGNNGDEPGFGGKDDACRRGALESSIAPHVAGGRRRARPAGPAAAARSGGRTPPGVVQISSNLSGKCSLALRADGRIAGEPDALHRLGAGDAAMTLV